MSYILGTILVLLVVIFSVAGYGLLSYHDFSLKKIWSNGWGTRMDALFIVACLLLSIKNLITL